MTDRTVEVGKHYKVSLPGESPWAECVGVYPDGSWEGRIDNHLVGSMTDAERRELVSKMFPGNPHELPSLHSFKLNDVVRFKADPDPEFSHLWIPAEQPAGHA